jgi:hypothetical protein
MFRIMSWDTGADHRKGNVNVTAPIFPGRPTRGDVEGGTDMRAASAKTEKKRGSAYPLDQQQQREASAEQIPQPAWKRGLDFALILLFAPAIIFVASVVTLIVRCGSRGPILFKQKRVGYKGREFVCYKFRTMQTNAETASHRNHLRDLINNQAPMPPPTKLTAPRRMRMIELSSIVRRYPNSPPNKPGTRATVQVALAILGSSPSQIIIGKTSNMPPPAIEFTTPAKNAARNIRAACQMDIGRKCNGRKAKGQELRERD